MKLELDRKETEAALLAYIETKFPGAFDHVELSSYKGCEFSHVEPEEEEKE